VALVAVAVIVPGSVSVGSVHEPQESVPPQPFEIVPQVTP
jgi:hypothetical protein